MLFDEANATPCYAIWNTMVIKTDGQVAVCCVDQCRNVTLGNVEIQSIAEVWKDSKELQKIREVHLREGRAGVDFCKDCLCWY